MDRNYWDVYPEDRVIRPFSSLYEEDNKEDRKENKKENKKEKSSRIMWGLRMLTVPTKDNPLWRMTNEERLDELSNILSQDELDKVIELRKAYVDAKMSYVMKRYLFYQDLLEQREDYMSTLSYTTDSDKLDDMLARTKKIWDEFMKIKKELEVEEDSGYVKGSREESATEKGLL